MRLARVGLLLLLLPLGLAAALGLAASWPRATAAPPSRDAEAGRVVYQRACATCHGQAGRGDGPSAVGFATKPTDLTDGRIMNPLPHEFLVNIIVNGGPAEGLSPGMPPFGGHLSGEQVAQVIAYVRSIAQPPFDPGAVLPVVTVPGAPAQPVFFSHLIHAGSFQIACQYCHADARRSPHAGLPSVDRCMGCHKVIGAQDNPEIAKVHEYWNRRAPIPWVRVFKVPEFTYFPHKAHVGAGVACQTCHGPVERMRVVGAPAGPNLVNDLQRLVGLGPASPPLSMGWCIDCHRTQNAQGRQAPLDCITCHH
jgi:mono/diheme cytochrome c family protein